MTEQRVSVTIYDGAESLQEVAYLTERAIGTLRGRIVAYLRECTERRTDRIAKAKDRLAAKRAELDAEEARLKGEE